MRYVGIGNYRKGVWIFIVVFAFADNWQTLSDRPYVLVQESLIPRHKCRSCCVSTYMLLRPQNMQRSASSRKCTKHRADSASSEDPAWFSSRMGRELEQCGRNKICFNRFAFVNLSRHGVMHYVLHTLFIHTLLRTHLRPSQARGIK